MLNDKAVSTVGLMAALFFSLIFTSIVLAYFVTEMGIDETIPQITIPNSVETYSQNQNFITGNYNKEMWGTKEGSFTNTIGTGISGTGYLLANNLNFDANNIITNTYIINNSGMADYGIVIVWTGGFDGDIIKVTNDGFYITSSMNGIIRYKEFIPYVWASQFTHPTITTTYDKSKSTCTFTLNSATFFTDTITPKDDIIEGVGLSRYYGGVTTQDAGFALEQFTTSNFVNGVDATQSGLSAILSFMTTAVLILGWTLPESVLPLILNVLLIKTQLVALTICFAQFIRGG